MDFEQKLTSVLFEKTPNAISYQRIMRDEHGTLVDCEAINVNRSFEALFHMSKEKIVGKKLSEAMPELLHEVAENGENVMVDQFVAALQKWLRMTVFALSENYLAVIYLDVSKELMQEKELQEKNEALMNLMSELQTANSMLKKLAITDELTGLYNRHFFDQRVSEEIERADRYNEPLTLIVFDLDHFKAVNDQWGHPVGDEVLQAVAGLANAIVRKTDSLNRIGGEEFAVLTPRTTLCGGVAVAEKLRLALSGHRHPQAGIVTASFGVAERMRTESFQSWYRRADAALYRAKKAGRNCVVECCENIAAASDNVRLEWRGEWESGNQTLDTQHKELLALANNLITLSMAGVRFAQVMVQLNLLLTHIERHFAVEGAILQGIGYPGAQQHALLHKQLFMKTLQMKELYQREGLQSAAFFSFIIDNVVVGHINNDDVQYFYYLKKQQV